jgi:hypothetical protein
MLSLSKHEGLRSDQIFTHHALSIWVPALAAPLSRLGRDDNFVNSAPAQRSPS